MERKDPVFTGWAQRGAFAELKPAVATDSPPPPPEPPLEPPPRPPADDDVAGAFARFVDRPGLYRLLLVNLALNVVTLTFYRFWARVRLRRHLWARVEVLGDPLEYTGTGGELFRGFLVALLFLVPLFGGFNVFLAFDPGELGKGIATAFFYVAFALLYWIAVFRTRRYRLSRTAWRGIRLGQSGSQWPFVFASMGWSLLVPLTLTLAVPFMRAWQARHLMNRTLVGDVPLACTLRGRSLVLPWLLVMAPVLLWGIMAAIRAMPLVFASPNRLATNALVESLMPWLFVAVGLAFLLFVNYRITELRRLVDGTAMEGTGFALAVQPGRLVLRLLGGGLLAFAALAVLLMTATLLLGAVGDIGRLMAGQPPPALIIGAGIAVAIIVLVIWPLLFWPLIYLPLLRRLAGGLRAEQSERLAAIGQSRQRTDKAGEGLADAFDVGFG